ncbi:MAG: AAA family ATPase [Nitrospirae bacterium YQR-1]
MLVDNLYKHVVSLVQNINWSYPSLTELTQMEFLQFIEFLWRRKSLIIAVAFTVIITVVILTLLIPTQYDSAARIFLKRPPSSTFVSSALGVTADTSTFSITDREDYLELAKLRQNAEQVIKELNLKTERIRGRFLRTLPFFRPFLKFLGVDVNSTHKKIRAEQLLNRSIINKIFPRPYIKINQYGDSDLYTITAYGSSPEEAMAIANSMSQAVVDGELNRIRESYKAAKEFIDSNIDGVKEQYMMSISKIKEFQESDNAVSLDSQASTLLSSIDTWNKTKITNDVSIKKTRDAIRLIEAKLNHVSEKAEEDVLLGQSEMISFYKQKMASLYTSLAEARSKYTEKHHTVIDFENQLVKIKELLYKEYEKLLDKRNLSTDTLFVEYKKKLLENYLELTSLESQNSIYPTIINMYEKKLQALPEKIFKNTSLNLGSTVANTVYSTLMTSRDRLGIVESLALSNISVVEPAICHDITTHKHPSLYLNFIISIALGIFVGILSAVFAEYMDDTIKSQDDLKKLKSLTLLGVLEKMTTSDSEAFATVSASIELLLRDHPDKIISVTSICCSEGKTFTSINLCKTLVEMDYKVLLVDTSTSNPSIEKHFGLTNNTGLSKISCTISNTTLTIHQNVIPGLDITTDCHGQKYPVKTEKFRQILEELKQNYNFILVDTEALITPSKSSALSLSNVIVVIESGKIRKKVLVEMLSMLKKAGVVNIGIVLNKIDAVYIRGYFKQVTFFFPENV